MTTSINALKYQVEDLQKNIELEQRRMEADSQAKREMLERQIEEIKTNLADLEAQQQEASRVRVEAQRRADGIRQEGQNAEKGVVPLQNKILEAQDMVNRARASMRDIWIPYGQNIKAVLEEIDRCQWIGDKPLGPLGRYVRAREPEKWGDILRGQLLNLLTAFAITNPKDREQLKKILGKYRK
jgi:chromosome segregation ATPase